jgi:predicted  nucleic acid-binding Zn-ribbon protein
MQHEIETGAAGAGAAEEKVLERMMESDQLTADIKKAEGERAARRKAIEAEKAEMNEDLRASTQQLAEKTAARDALVKAMPAQTVALFDQVARVRKGVATIGGHARRAVLRSATCVCGRPSSSRCA